MKYVLILSVFLTSVAFAQDLSKCKISAINAAKKLCKTELEYCGKAKVTDSLVNKDSIVHLVEIQFENGDSYGDAYYTVTMKPEIVGEKTVCKLVKID